MEWVKSNKMHIKHTFSDKTVSNIETKLSALESISKTCVKFDDKLGVVKRYQCHKVKDIEEDEETITEDLRKVHPFEHDCNRVHDSLGKTETSLIPQLCQLVCYVQPNNFTRLCKHTFNLLWVTHY